MANLTKEQREAKLKAQQEEKDNEIAELKALLKAQQEEFQNLLKVQQADFDAKMKEQNSNQEEPVKKTATRAKQIQKAKKIPLETVVPVICNTYGGATYKSKKMQGYTVEWDDYGAEEFMELSELVAMRNTDRRFFVDNWIVLGDTEDYSAIEIYDFLKVTNLYEKALTPENIDSIFDMEGDQIIKVIAGMSNGMKSTIASIALSKIQSNELDSQSKINAFETALNVKFSI